jgi:hypothetical protein
LAVVDAERVPGLGRTSIEDFAPGPNGETYLMARRVFKQYYFRDEHGQVAPSGRADYPEVWLVRYDKNGDFVDKKQVNAASRVRFAVFPSGELFVLSYGTNNHQVRLSDLPLSWMVVAGVFSRDGVLLHSVTLPDFFLNTVSGKSRIPSPTPLPMLGADGDVYVVKEGATPALAVISPEGTAIRITTLAVPRGQALDFSRLIGNRLIARMAPFEPTGSFQQSFAEFDTETGAMVSNYKFSKANWMPGCDLGSGLTGINPAGTLDMLSPIQSSGNKLSSLQ